MSKLIAAFTGYAPSLSRRAARAPMIVDAALLPEIAVVITQICAQRRHEILAQRGVRRVGSSMSGPGYKTIRLPVSLPTAVTPQVKHPTMGAGVRVSSFPVWRGPMIGAFRY